MLMCVVTGVFVCRTVGMCVFVCVQVFLCVSLCLRMRVFALVCDV